MDAEKHLTKFELEEEYERVYKIYLADKNVLALNFRILIAFEKWPSDRRVNEKGNIFKYESDLLKDELKLIDSQMQAYLLANYAILKL